MILTKLPLVLWACVIVVLGTSSAYQFANLLDTSREIESIKDVTIQMLTCRRHEKDFINRNDKQYVEKHRQAFEKLRLASHELGELGTTSELTKGLLSYKAHFANIVYATEEIGLTENDGLRGSLRSAIHEVEAALQNADNGDFEKQMLSCRRFEKDFLIRKDQRSYERFSASVDRFLSEASTAPNSFLLYDGILRYRQAFDGLVQKIRFIGVDQSSGIRKELRESIQTVEAKLLTLSERAKTDHDENEHHANMFAGLVSAILLVSLGLVIKLGRVNKLLTAQSRDDRDAETTS